MCHKANFMVCVVLFKHSFMELRMLLQSFRTAGAIPFDLINGVQNQRNFSLSQKNFARKRHVPLSLRCFLLAILFALVAQNAALAVDQYWNVAEGEWNVVSNWTSATPRVPTMNDKAYVDNGYTVNITGYEVVSPLTVVTGYLNVRDGGYLNMVPSSARELWIAQHENSYGEVNVTGAGSALRTSGFHAGYGEGSTAYINVSDGAIVTSTTTISSLGTGINSYGELNVTGEGTEFNANIWTIAKGAGSTAVCNVLDGAKLACSSTLYLAYSNNADASLTVSGSGSLVSASTAFRMGYPTSSVGTVTQVAVLDGGKISAANIHLQGTNNALLISGEGSTFEGTSNFSVGNTSGSTTTIDLLDHAIFSITGNVGLAVENTNTTVNIRESTFHSGVVSSSGNNSSVDMNILLSGSDIQMTSISGANTHFYFDSTSKGTSAIAVTSTAVNAINLNGEHIVNAYGFAVQNVDNVFTLYSGQTNSYTGTFSMEKAPGMVVVSNGKTDDQNAGLFQVGFDQESTPVWDLKTETLFTPDDGNAGWVILKGEPKFNFIATFDLGTTATSSLANALLNHLNSGLSGSGALFMLVGTGENTASYLLSREFFANNDYNVLGWGLTYFNEQNGTNVSLLNIVHNPEPSTWVLLLSGFGGVAVMWRRRKRK